MNEYYEQTKRTGGVLGGGLFEDEIETHIKASLPDHPCDQSHKRGGVRNPQSRYPCLLPAIDSPKIENLLGRKFQLIRSILFDKTAGANWAVLWHQDRTIAVKEKREVDGFGP